MLALLIKMILFRFLIVFRFSVVVNLDTFNQAFQVVPGTHHLVGVGLLVLQFQERFLGELANQVVEHVLAHVLVGEMLAQPVELVLQHHVDVGLHQNLFGLEAEILAGQKIRTVEDMKRQAKEMLKLGCKGVLIKGGHLDGGLMCDVLQTATEEAPHLFTAPKVNSRNTHGTGCTLSSAIATFLALGEPMSVAVKKAKQYVYKGIESGKDVCIGGGHGPLNHFHSPVAMHIFDKNE